MKKKLAITLIVVLILAMFIGCTPNGTDTSDQTDKDKIDQTDKDKVDEVDEVDETDKDKTDQDNNITRFTDGTHEGAGKGYGGDIKVSVEVVDSKIKSIEILEHKETPGIGDKAPEEIADKIVEEQSLDVEAISGATMSSKGTIEAVKNALEK